MDGIIWTAVAGAGITFGKKGFSVTAEEKVLVALVVVCFTEAIRIILYGLLPLVAEGLLGF